MLAKAAQARNKIYKLLPSDGWRFLDGVQIDANIVLKRNVKLMLSQADGLGSGFETSSKGFIDFWLLD